MTRCLLEAQGLQSVEWIKDGATIHDQVGASHKVSSLVASQVNNRISNVLGQASMWKQLHLFVHVPDFFLSEKYRSIQQL